MCYNDFLLELSEAPDGIKVYRSKEDAINNLSCAKSCGIVRVKVSFDKIILKGDDNG